MAWDTDEPLVLPYVNEGRQHEFQEVCNRILNIIEQRIPTRTFPKPVDLIDQLQHQLRVDKQLVMDAIAYLIKKKKIAPLWSSADYSVDVNDFPKEEVIHITRFEKKKLILEKHKKDVLDLAQRLKQVIMENPGILVSPDLFKRLSLDWNICFDRLNSGRF